MTTYVVYRWVLPEHEFRGHHHNPPHPRTHDVVAVTGDPAVALAARNAAILDGTPAFLERVPSE